MVVRNAGMIAFAVRIHAGKRAENTVEEAANKILRTRLETERQHNGVFLSRGDIYLSGNLFSSVCEL